MFHFTQKQRIIYGRHVIGERALALGVRRQNLKFQFFHLKEYVAIEKWLSPVVLNRSHTAKWLVQLKHTSTGTTLLKFWFNRSEIGLCTVQKQMRSIMTDISIELLNFRVLICKIPIRIPNPLHRVIVKIKYYDIFQVLSTSCLEVHFFVFQWLLVSLGFRVPQSRFEGWDALWENSAPTSHTWQCPGCSLPDYWWDC